MSDDILAIGKKRAEELGLRTHVFKVSTLEDAITGNPLNGVHRDYYDAESVRRLFGVGREVFGSITSGDWPTKDYWFTGEQKDNVHLSKLDSHAALAIGIRPVSQESEERKLLREFVEDWEKYHPGWAANAEVKNRAKLHERARALLERE